MERTARHAFVSGRVQGVGFRWHTREKARELGLAGWVRNLNDGRVEAWIAGEVDQVELMLAWLRAGPASAEVRELVVQEVESQAAPADSSGAMSFEG